MPCGVHDRSVTALFWSALSFWEISTKTSYTLWRPNGTGFNAEFDVGAEIPTDLMTRKRKQARRMSAGPGFDRIFRKQDA
jgi:hypothetical protein